MEGEERRGSEWGYFDNTKHLLFWLYNIKQLIFSHFNTNIKKFVNESDPRSYVHYLGSSENNAWKKFQACTGFEPMDLNPLLPK